MRKIFYLLLVVALLLSAASCAFADQPDREFRGDFSPSNNGERLLALLVSLTDPESIELRIDQNPDDAGRVRDLSLLISGASISGFRVERFAIESAFLELNPVSEWRMGDRNSLMARSSLRTNVELAVLEKDINEALKTYVGGDWSRISLDLKPGRINAKGHYSSGGLSIFAEVTTRLEIKQGKQIWLKDTAIKINNDDQTEVIKKELAKIQPLVDIGQFPLPISLTVLNIDEHRVVFSTRTLPKPVNGIYYRYVKGS
ncbi:MAG: hypothetical protein WCY56_01285 [Aminobacteriaceae bacterium]